MALCHDSSHRYLEHSVNARHSSLCSLTVGMGTAKRGLQMDKGKRERRGRDKHRARVRMRKAREKQGAASLYLHLKIWNNG